MPADVKRSTESKRFTGSDSVSPGRNGDDDDETLVVVVTRRRCADFARRIYTSLDQLQLLNELSTADH